MSHRCNQLRADGKSYCDQKIATGRDTCESGHYSPPPLLEVAPRLRGLPASLRSLDIDDVVLPRPSEQKLV